MTRIAPRAPGRARAVSSTGSGTRFSRPDDSRVVFLETASFWQEERGKEGCKEEVRMPSKSANVKNEKQYEKLKKKGMSKERAAKIANSPGASSRGGKKSGSGSSKSSSSQGGTTAQKKAAGRKGGKASSGKS
jgi:hypothetical protein